MKLFFSLAAVVGLFFSASLFSECTQDFCSFEVGKESISFYGSRGAYNLYESQNIDKHTFEGIGSFLSLEKICKGDLDAGFFSIDEKAFEELYRKGDLNDVSQDIFLLGSGKVVLIGNKAFLKALKKDTVITNELQEIVSSGKVNAETIEWHVFTTTSSTDALGWQTLSKGLNGPHKVKKVVVDDKEFLTKSNEYGMSKTPIAFFANTELLDFRKKEIDLEKNGWKEVDWQDSPSLNYYIAVFKGPHYDTIISNLKSMKAQRVAKK